MGLYITEEDVKVRLIGKVRFTEADEDENKMSIKLLRRLIAEAEGAVEFDLSPRYAAPFQTKAGTAFKNLPQYPTREIIRTLCELQAVIRVLETDFGSGSVVDADKYKEKLEKRYKTMVDDRILAKKNNSDAWMYPPVPQLRLNYMNEEADDGFQGQILNTSDSNGGYPAHQINDPAVNFWTGDKDNGGPVY